MKLADLKDFTERYPLNSRLVKMDGHLVKNRFTARGRRTTASRLVCTPNISPKRIPILRRRPNWPSPAQAKAIRDLIRYYQTGDPKDWLQFDIDWVQNNAAVDFANGFIEVYRDARGAKATSQSFVTVIDSAVDALMPEDRRQRSIFRRSCSLGAAIPQARREAPARQERWKR